MVRSAAADCVASSTRLFAVQPRHQHVVDAGAGRVVEQHQRAAEARPNAVLELVQRDRDVVALAGRRVPIERHRARVGFGEALRQVGVAVGTAPAASRRRSRSAPAGPA